MMDMRNVIGYTDTGQPLVLAEHACEHWSPGQTPTINRRICWYCKYADFRKTTGAVLVQSVCRCVENRKVILTGTENEDL